MNKFWDKFLKILPIILFFCYFVLFINVMPIEPYDELWNFHNILKMYNGGIIYVDSNVIITPLFFYIGQLFLKILGPTIVSFRIYHAVMSYIFLFVLFLILKELKVSKHISVLMISSVLLLIAPAINGRS